MRPCSSTPAVTGLACGLPSRRCVMRTIWCRGRTKSSSWSRSTESLVAMVRAMPHSLSRAPVRRRATAAPDAAPPVARRTPAPVARRAPDAADARRPGPAVRAFVRRHAAHRGVTSYGSCSAQPPVSFSRRAASASSEASVPPPWEAPLSGRTRTSCRRSRTSSRSSSTAAGGVGRRGARRWPQPRRRPSSPASTWALVRLPAGVGLGVLLLPLLALGLEALEPLVGLRVEALGVLVVALLVVLGGHAVERRVELGDRAAPRRWPA